MKTRAAILRQAPGEWEIAEVDLADPTYGEIQVKMMVAGLCHSDDHLATGDLPLGHFPMAGGHEGAGVVVKVGPGVRGYAEGDRVVVLCVASCGTCRWCASGMQNLCELNAELLGGGTPEDPKRYRLQLDGVPVGQWVGVSSFSEYTTVSTSTVMKVADDLPFEAVAMASCGGATGWGAAVNTAGVRPGHVVIVAGVGGVGMSAVQGARNAGAGHIIVADPVAYKRDRAPEFGATHVAVSIVEAGEIAKSLTNGQGADSAVVAVGVVQSRDVADAFTAIRKGGTVSVVGMASMTNQAPLDISVGELTFFQKQIRGCLYGGKASRETITNLLELYRDGHLKLDELVTRRYTLDEINEGYADMRAGRNIRGIITFA